jgi:ribosomal-protein-alanine N-acetyltransferase
MLEPDLSSIASLTTGRLLLRQLTPHDAAAIHAIRSDPRVMAHVCRPRSTGLEDAEALIRRTQEDRAANTGISWGMVPHGGDAVIGTIGLYRLKPEHHCAEVGYVLSPDHWGKGLMSEALEAVAAAAFERLRFHRLEAITDPDNVRSRRLLERHGFRLEGILRESYYWEGRFTGAAVHGRLRTDPPPA